MATGVATGMAAGVAPVVASLAEQVRAAARDDTPLRIVGGASWLDAGRPCTGEALNVGQLRGIVEYVPGDLTLTAGAGTTLAELREATAAHGQWLGLDPNADPAATIGATVATASDGPLAISMGRVRDMVLGVQCITGTGAVVRAGGRVVKNVAGFDLVRLHTGAWGTLGVITEVSLRLRARPPVDRSFLFAGDDRLSLEARLAPLADLTIDPLAMELLNAPMATALGLAPATCILVRLGGNAERVDAQRDALQAMGEATEVSSALFDEMSRLESRLESRMESGVESRRERGASEKETGAELVPRVSVRASHSPSLLPALWRHMLEQSAAHQLWQPLMRASLTRGVVRLVLDREDSAAIARSDAATTFVRELAPPGAHAAWERLPSALWRAVPSPVADAVSGAIRSALDPQHILNRGLLGEPAARSATLDGGAA